MENNCHSAARQAEERAETPSSCPEEVLHQEAQPAISPEIDHILSRLLLLEFVGKAPSDAGVRAVQSLLQSGHIAGTVFSGENIVSKSQLKEMMKFLWPGMIKGGQYSQFGNSGGDFPRFR